MTQPTSLNQALSQSLSAAISNPPNFLIIGQGDIGLSVSNQLVKLGFNVTGLARKARNQYNLSSAAAFMQTDARYITAEQLAGFTHIAIIVTPDDYNADAYKQTYFGIAARMAELSEQLRDLQRVVFISSTGVYGQNNGEWIDVTVAPQLPKREGSRFILRAEEVLQQAFNKRAVMIRPSGIYGVNRLMRIRQTQQSVKEAMSPLSWTNRIMDSDLVNIIVKVLTLPDNKLLDNKQNEQVAPIYLATDFMPVTSYELTRWLSEQLDSPLPTIDESKKNQQTGKRLHSNIPIDWLQYPDWQAGYRKVLQSIQ